MSNHAPSDQQVVAGIAMILGTAPEWSAEQLEQIADLVGVVRPHPGDYQEPSEYEVEFRRETGRSLAGDGP